MGTRQGFTAYKPIKPAIIDTYHTINFMHNKLYTVSQIFKIFQIIHKMVKTMFVSFFTILMELI